MPVEHWVSIKGTEELYDVSNLGRVRAWTKAKQGSCLKPTPNAGGYLHVNLKFGTRWLVRSVHTLVAEGFLGPKPEGLVVRHLDGDPTNNALPNLSYGTHTDNAGDRTRHGRSRGRTDRLEVGMHCKRGHFLSEDRLRINKDGSRACKTCGTENEARRRERKRLEVDSQPNT